MTVEEPESDRQVVQAEHIEPEPGEFVTAAGGGADAPSGTADARFSTSYPAGYRSSQMSAADKEFKGAGGHAPDYSWLQGRLEYSALRGGIWKLRYAPFDVDDRYGGSVVLQADPAQHGLRPGDLVRVEGRVVESGLQRSFASPFYRVTNIRRLGDWPASAAQHPGP